MDKTHAISFPFTEWHGKTVILSRAPARSLFVYLPEEFKKLEEDIERNAVEYALTYPRFREFMRAGLLEAEIAPDGILTIPDYLYTYLGQKGEIEVHRGQYGLEIRRVYEEMCRCDDPSCGKCLAVGCRDDECSTHTREAKARRRS